MEIRDLIPHRDPMLFVGDEYRIEPESRLIEVDACYNEKSLFLLNSGEKTSAVPETILCESVFQAGALLLKKIENCGKGIPVVSRMSKCRFFEVVTSDEPIKLYASLVDKVSNAFYMQGHAIRNGKKILELEFVCMLAAVENLK